MRQSKSLILFAGRGIRCTPMLGLLLLVQFLLAGCGTNANQGPASAQATATPSGVGIAINISPQAAATATPTTSARVPTVSPTTLAANNGLITAPGSPLPTEQQCTARVQRSTFEPRPENLQANQSVPTSQQLAHVGPWDEHIGQSIQADNLRKQITGNFTGTTDEILQWVACKWGVSPDLVRAEAVVESYWKQSLQGDYTNDKTLCPPNGWDGQGCYQSYGILQINYYYFQDAWPMSRDDTAFNAEYVYGILRACYEGWTTYLSATTPLPGYQPYHAGDIWGCLGRWFSGSWYNQDAVNYIQKVKDTLAEKTWLQTGF